VKALAEVAICGSGGRRRGAVCVTEQRGPGYPSPCVSVGVPTGGGRDGERALRRASRLVRVVGVAWWQGLL